MFYLLFLRKGTVPISDPTVLEIMSEISNDLPKDNMYCENSFNKPIDTVINKAIPIRFENLSFKDIIHPKLITAYQMKWIKISELLGNIDGISLAGILLATITARVHIMVKIK